MSDVSDWVERRAQEINGNVASYLREAYDMGFGDGQTVVFDRVNELSAEIAGLKAENEDLKLRCAKGMCV